MGELQAYKSIAGIAQAEFVEKKSRFIGQISPAGDESAAQAFLESVRTTYRDATHHVYALQIGAHNEIQRSNDAGEPAGTGGRPILEAIKNAGLQNVIIVVTRYYGGTLLGTGGLTRAYGKGAQLAIQAAEKVLVVPAQLCALHFDYGQLGRMEAYLAEQNYPIRDKSYQENVCFLLAVPLTEWELLQQKLLDLTAGSIKMQALGEHIWLNQPLAGE